MFAEDEARLLGADESQIARRIAGERLEHVLGWVDFGGLRIEVDPGVFIPRPQTAALADAAASLHPSVALDLFAGSGAIAAVIKARNPRSRVVAADLHVPACLRRNCHEVYESDVDGGIPTELEARVDVLTANVPYVPTAALQYVPHDGEPVSAIDGGPDGLDWTRRLIACAPRWLRPGGSLITEIAESQRPAVEALLASAAFNGFSYVLVDASKRPPEAVSPGA